MQRSGAPDVECSDVERRDRGDRREEYLNGDLGDLCDLCVYRRDRDRL